MTNESTLSPRGQITVPKDVRARLRAKPGDRLTFTAMPDGSMLMRVKNKSVMSLVSR